LSEGQEITVEDLLYAIMLRSANDAAVVAAEHIAGSVQAFSVMMNQKARQAGARHSHFKNPHGLTEEGHLTTAYDLAMITRYAMGNPVFRKIAATSRHVIPWPGEDRTVVNEIPLLGNYEGMLGVKSGYTLEAKRTFVAAAGRDGLELIAVVLHAPGTRVWEDARILLDYGFQNFNVQKPLEKGDELATRQARFGGPVSLVAAEDLEFTHPTGSGDVAVELRIQEKIKAPVAAGQALGEAVVFYDGKPVGSVALVAAGDVARAAPYTARFWFLTVLGTLFCLRGRKLYRDHKRRRRLLRKKRNSPRLSRRFK
jgi:D-alanyl-D-alanine carboxypeptidase (penicillin-binding protein 5/6)